MPQIDWARYSDFCKSVTNTRPTTVVDEHGLDAKKPSTFLATLRPELRPQEALKDKKLQRHIYLSFMGEVDTHTLATVASVPDLYVTTQEQLRGLFFIIVSGTLHAWIEAVYSESTESNTGDVRAFFNVVLINLERAGFKSLFSSVKRKQLKDGTFTL